MLSPITVDTSSIINDTSRHQIGININYLRDNNCNTPDARPIQEALKEMGVRFLRYPGGEKSDYHLWSLPPYISPNPQVFDRISRSTCYYKTEYAAGHKMLNFDEFMGYCNEVNVTPHIVVGATPFEHGGERQILQEQYIEHAVSWVKYSNITKKYGIKYWEIGNENWQTFSPEENAKLAIVFSRAMKEVDPTIKIGICGNSKEYFVAVLEIAGEYIDFITCSNYPCFEWGSYDYYVKNPYIDLNPEETSAIEALNEVKDGYYKDKVKVAAVEINSWDWSNGWSTDNTLGHALVTFETLGQALSKPEVEYALLWGTRWMDYNGKGISEALGPKNEINPSGRAVAIWGQFLQDKLVQISRTDSVITFASMDSKNGNLNLFLSNKSYSKEKVCINISQEYSYKTRQYFQFKGTGCDDMQPEWSKTCSVDARENEIPDLELPAISLTVICLKAGE